MLLLQLTLLCSAESVSIDREKYKELLADNLEKPLFIDLWDPFCHHCREFRRIWENLASLPKFSNSVIFANINCDENRKWCREFGVRGYPSVVFEDQANEVKFVYDGPRTVEAMSSFLDKQLTLPVRFILNDFQLKRSIEHTNLSSVFHLTFLKEDGVKLELFKDLARAFRKSGCA